MGIKIGSTYRIQATDSIVMVTDVESREHGLYIGVVLTSKVHAADETIPLYEDELGASIALRLEVME